MSYMDELITMMVVGAVIYLACLAACIGVPILICKLFHIRVNLWYVGVISGLAWIVGYWIWYNWPM